MKPLRVEAAAFPKLHCQYPDPATFRETVRLLSQNSRESVVRLWLTEGVPFAFRDCPAVYEAVRAWLGANLKVCPKEITLLGSARVGFCLAPAPDYGRAFTSQSDLDLSVVSSSLFEELSRSFAQWQEDYSAQTIQPRHQRERQFWDENIRLARGNASKGFLDANKLPTLHRYPIAQRVAQAMWLLKRKLEITDGAPKVREASVRVYSTWRALVTRVSFNLRTALFDGPT